MTTRLLATALLIGAMLLPVAQAHAVLPADFFTQSNVQTHTPGSGVNGTFVRNVIINSISYSSNQQEFIDPVLDAFSQSRRYEFSYASADLANGRLRSWILGSLTAPAPGGAIALSAALIGDRYSIHRTPVAFGQQSGDTVQFTLTLHDAGSGLTVNPGTSPSDFFNRSILGVIIAKPGTLDADVPFVSPNYICSFYWGLGAGATSTSVPLISVLTTFPQTLTTPPCDLTAGGYSDFDWTVLIRPSVGTNSVGSRFDFNFSQTMEASFSVPPGTTVTSASGFVAGVTPQATSLFLRGAGPIGNPPALFLDTAPPVGKVAKYKDSGGIKFAGGNQWAEIGTWAADPFDFPDSLSLMTSLQALHVWLGLKNSDDQGTSFDLKAVVLSNGSQIGEGVLRCIKGLTRDPGKAKEVVVVPALGANQSFNGTTDTLSVKLLTRIGTNLDGTKCAGHSNAVGVRAYFDAVGRDARLNAVLEED